MKIMLDLCSGFGGASQAFEASTEWKVERYDNNIQIIQHPDTPPTHFINLLTESISHPMRPDLIWASPPCYEFSDAYKTPLGRAQRNGDIDAYAPSLALVERCLEEIQHLAPTFWVIENVKGAIPYFKELLGEPRQIIGPFVLWGNFPLLADVEIEHDHKAKADKRHSPLRANHRAKIPLQISEALLIAVRDQRTLF